MKTYPEAEELLKEQHLKSVTLLECKCEDLLNREFALEQYMKQLSGEFQAAEQKIVCYYDRIQELAEKKKLEMLCELDEHHRSYSRDLARTIDGVHQNIFEVKRLVQLLKNFSLGAENINRLVQQKHALDKALELQTEKSGLASVPPPPRVVEVYDLEYHLQSSLRVMRDDHITLIDEHPTLDPTNDSSCESFTATGQHFKRTVKLVEKVRHKLNSTCDMFGY